MNTGILLLLVTMTTSVGSDADRVEDMLARNLEAIDTMCPAHRTPCVEARETFRRSSDLDSALVFLRQIGCADACYRIDGDPRPRCFAS